MVTYKQVVSKQRVAKHGEVFTNPREVNAMLDLVKAETENIFSRFLEPACGKGVFLAEVLHRKLKIVKNRYGKRPIEYERYAVIAVSSIYGIELLKDNVEDCRQDMLDIFLAEYKEATGKDCSAECKQTVKFILRKNIIWGDALTLKRIDEPDKPIVFSKWSAIDANVKKIQRHDFTFKQLLQDTNKNQERTLFEEPESDPWQPIKTFPPVNYLRLEDAESTI